MRHLLLLSISISLALAGCATSGLSGTTTLSSKYDSQVQADGSDHTMVDITAKGKAGDVLQAVSQASLLTKDGSGSERNMTFGATQSNDATLRAQTIKDLNEMYVAVMNNALSTLQAGMALAAPLIGQRIDVQGANAQAGIAAKAAFRQQLLEALRDPGVLRAMTGAGPAVRPAPQPVVEPPVVPAPVPVPVLESAPAGIVSP